MAIKRNVVDVSQFNGEAQLPYELRRQDFQMAMQDVYDFLDDVNAHLTGNGLQRLDDVLCPAITSGLLSDTLTAILAKHSRVLTENAYFNGHPDLIVQGRYRRSCSAGRCRRRGSQDHKKSRRRSRYSRGARAVDVCFHLYGRYRLGISHGPSIDDVHGSLTRTGDNE